MKRRDFLRGATGAMLGAAVGPSCFFREREPREEAEGSGGLAGRRCLTFNSVIRANQIEVTRTRNEGFDEYDRHTPENVRALRQALVEGWPGGLAGSAGRERWPSAECLLLGDFGQAWRQTHRNNDKIDYLFRQRGTGIGGSDADLEIRWFMNKQFRLALLRNWQRDEPEDVIDFTRYDLLAREPRKLTRSWSLMNRINQKGTRPQDRPVPIASLPEEDRRIILGRYPELG